jgi:DNA-binding LytR/AlgR family response regulator
VDSSKSLVVKNIGEENYLMDDRIFVRHQDKMVKLFLHEVLYVEADRSYCKIYTDTKEYLLSVPLGHLEEKLPKRNFQRVHRSFVVNLEKIDAIGEQQEWLVLGNRNVPLSRNFRDELMARLRLI